MAALPSFSFFYSAEITLLYLFFDIVIYPLLRSNVKSQYAKLPVLSHSPHAMQYMKNINIERRITVHNSCTRIFSISTSQTLKFKIKFLYHSYCSILFMLVSEMITHVHVYVRKCTWSTFIYIWIAYPIPYGLLRNKVQTNVARKCEVKILCWI